MKIYERAQNGMEWGRSMFVVVNPAAAGGAVGEEWGEISLLLNEVLGPYGWSMTQRPGDATALARQALKDGFEVIVSLGGDGTHNEVVNGFFEGGEPLREGATLGLLPHGTGGDFRKTLGLSGEMREAAEVLLRGRRRRCDVGKLTYTAEVRNTADRYFINIASFGLSGLVDRKVNASGKRLGGTISFALATLQALSAYKPPTVRLLIDERLEVEVEIVNVAIANGKYFGGGMKIAPNADLGDGLFDVIVVKPGDMIATVESALKVYGGRHFESGTVSYFSAQKVQATPASLSDVVLLDVDGESPGRLPATFEVLPGAIQIVY